MIKISEVIAKFKLRTGIQKDLLLNDLAMSVYGQLKLATNTEYTLKVKYLPISNLGTASMPDDYVVYNKVGLVFKGEIWTLTVNDKLLPPRKDTDDCGISTTEAIEQGAESTVDRWYFSPHRNKEGVYIGKLYGLGGGFNSKGYFRENKANRTFDLSGVTGSEIVLEYLSNDVGLDTLIPDHFVETMMAGMKYEFEINTPMPSNVKVRLAAENFQAKMELTRAVETPFRMDEYLDMFYENVHLSVKR